jgi:anti-anti-sigma factor
MSTSKDTSAPSFDLDSSQEGSMALISLSGEFDMSARQQFEDALREVDSSQTARVVIDLRNVRFIDSAGLQMILKGSSWCREHGLGFALVRGPENVQHLFELSALNLTIPIVDQPPTDSPSDPPARAPRS